MGQPLISIIIPVYNGERYLKQCLDSVINQNNPDYEAIIVNDGSVDLSKDICEEYVRKDSRFKLINKENGGVSIARNVGLQYARGKWICFIDADDWISPDFLNIEYPDADVIQKGYVDVSNNNTLRESYITTSSVLNRKNEIYKFFVNHRNNQLWNKLISARLINTQRFNEKVKIGEDLLFFLSIIDNVKLYAFSSTGYYYYRVNDDSAMAKVSGNNKLRLKIIEDNITNIRNIGNEQLSQDLTESIIYESYYPYLYLYRKTLTTSQKNLFVSLRKSFGMRKIKSLTFVNKLKVITRIIYSYF